MRASSDASSASSIGIQRGLGRAVAVATAMASTSKASSSNEALALVSPPFGVGWAQQPLIVFSFVVVSPGVVDV